MFPENGLQIHHTKYPSTEVRSFSITKFSAQTLQTLVFLICALLLFAYFIFQLLIAF